MKAARQSLTSKQDDNKRDTDQRSPSKMAGDKFSIPTEISAEPQATNTTVGSLRRPSSSHHPTTAHTHDDDDSDNSYVCEFNQDTAKWECVRYYKTQILQDVIDRHDNKDGRATIDQLKDFGITVYLTDHDCVNNDVLVKVVEHASAANNDRTRADFGNQRCLLYRDEKGRLYNLTLNNGCSGLAGTWKSMLKSYSGVDAMIAITILTRVFSCADPDARASVRPGYLSLLLGLILYEEISHVWVNCSMFVRGTPSIAAYTLISNFESDFPRKFIVLVLAMAAAQEPGTDVQRYLTVGGITFAIAVLLANLGARAWKFMKWKPMGQGGFFAPIISFFVAFLTGLIFPYMGFGQIQAGGKVAVQLVILNCLVVALIFMASDIDGVQKFIVVGSESCNQDITNITLGIWFTLTSITCIFAAKKIVPPIPHPEDSDPILVEDQTSPVGFKVPNFPDYPIDPIFFGGNGFSWCSLHAEVVLGLIASIAIGALVVSSGLYDYLGYANDVIENNING